MDKVGPIKRRMPAAILFFLFFWNLPPVRGGPMVPDDVDLVSILKKTAAYCRKLDASVLDFFCREEVEETIDLSREMWNSYESHRDGSGSFSVPTSFKRRSKNRYTYDYQCVRSNRIVKEKRTLLEINQKKRNDRVNSPQTRSVSYRNPFLYPANLFAENVQKEYNFHIAGTDVISDKKVVVVEAIPISGGGSEPRFLTGKAWIDPETAEIWKMECTEKPAERVEVFSKREELNNGKLRLTTRAEFKTEKNSFRFPTILTIEEAYLNVHGSAYIRSVTKVNFVDFHFFTVEIDVPIL